MGQELFQKLTECIEFGNVNIISPFPTQTKEPQDAYKLTFKVLEHGISPQNI